ncbi:cation diffusion facilitator family transporter [Sporolactobacillus shoreicorticis]|uniref:Cation diffusion facilitator family transporter n=1 Tax=Sporolactobacillus shoreicorticis TaxID=1923877 RepID=A0ABW5S9L8_9BACL|nr:cation diffusion facilitator family transporter [Sporolactobacillus shoreicorticis]MCO7126081.1 cation diffusion facilitator family transporter [Sporolactobacillus shoreicorticis]
MTYEGPKALLTAWVSLVSNLLLTLIKIIFGLIFHSTALVADGVHNGGDVIASIATIGSMKLSNHPADREHPYGHGKAEDISTAFISIVLIVAALFLTYEAVKALFGPISSVSIWAFAAALFSALAKWLLYIYTKKGADRYHSKSLYATAADHLADIYASIAAALGLGIGWIGTIFHLPYTHYGDPVAGIVVSILILRIAIVMIIKAINVLMESSVDESVQEKYRQVFLSFPEVKVIDILRAREHGNVVLIDAQIRIPASYTIQEGDDLTEAIRSKMIHTYPNVDEVLIHINPWYKDQVLVEPDSVPHLEKK